MTGLPLYDLLTVKRAAEVLHKSEQGVRRLVSAGKLEAVREGGKLLITPESVAAYVAGLKHPPEVMEAMHTAGNLLGGAERLQRYAGGARIMPRLEYHPDPFIRLCLVPSLPVCRSILAAVKVKDYPRVLDLRAELWRIALDYRILHEPFKTPPPPRGKREAVPSVLPSLFPELEGGQA